MIVAGKLIWKSLTPRSKSQVKRKLKETVTPKESKILRKQVGVNIEKAVTMKETDRDDLKKQVNKFLEENSTICPDKDKVKD